MPMEHVLTDISPHFGDAVDALWLSTQALYDRFDFVPPYDDQSALILEELDEFFYELEQFESTPASRRIGRPSLEALDEFADVLVTLFGMLQKYGYTRGEIAGAVLRVAAKNHDKTLQTHVLTRDVSGTLKIRRREAPTVVEDHREWDE